jgi:hypothetical protein
VQWTESKVAGARVYGLSLNESHRLADQRLRLKKCKGVSDNLIVVINAGMEASGDSAGRGGAIAAACPTRGGGSPE